MPTLAPQDGRQNLFQPCLPCLDDMHFVVRFEDDIGPRIAGPNSRQVYLESLGRLPGGNVSPNDSGFVGIGLPCSAARSAQQIGDALGTGKRNGPRPAFYWPQDV